VFQLKKNSVKVMSDSENEGQQQIADVPPAPDPSNEANKDASELQGAAAKKAKQNSRERVWELGPNKCRLQVHKE
jgi:hypothetical protein